MMRAMGILGGIAVGMVHSVQNGVSSRGQVGAALPHPGEEIEELFPIFVHVEHLMGGISV